MPVFYCDADRHDDENLYLYLRFHAGRLCFTPKRSRATDFHIESATDATPIPSLAAAATHPAVILRVTGDKKLPDLHWTIAPHPTRSGAFRIGQSTTYGIGVLLDPDTEDVAPILTDTRSLIAAFGEAAPITEYSCLCEEMETGRRCRNCRR
jgi:hypothetical protein